MKSSKFVRETGKETQPKKLSLKDRATFLSDLAGGHESAIKALTVKMVGTHGAEKIMLQQEIEKSKSLMLQCKDLADLEKEKVAGKAAEIASPEIIAQREESKKAADNSGLNKEISAALEKINENAKHGLESDVSTSRIGDKVKITVEAREPEKDRSPGNSPARTGEVKGEWSAYIKNREENAKSQSQGGGMTQSH